MAGQLRVHLVFVVKFRKKLITPSIRNALIRYFHRSCEDLNSKLIECNGEEDHIHLLIEYPTTKSISEIVRKLKGYSSAKIRKFPSILKHKWMKSFWSSGFYAVSCGGASLEKIKDYIQNQDQLTSPG